MHIIQLAALGGGWRALRLCLLHAHPLYSLCTSWDPAPIQALNHLTPPSLPPTLALALAARRRDCRDLRGSARPRRGGRVCAEPHRAGVCVRHQQAHVRWAGLWKWRRHPQVRTFVPLHGARRRWSNQLATLQRCGSARATLPIGQSGRLCRLMLCIPTPSAMLPSPTSQQPWP